MTNVNRLEVTLDNGCHFNAAGSMTMPDVLRMYRETIGGFAVVEPLSDPERSTDIELQAEYQARPARPGLFDDDAQGVEQAERGRELNYQRSQLETIRKVGKMTCNELEIASAEIDDPVKLTKLAYDVIRNWTIERTRTMHEAGQVMRALTRFGFAVGDPDMGGADLLQKAAHFIDVRKREGWVLGMQSTDQVASKPEALGDFLKRKEAGQVSDDERAALANSMMAVHTRMNYLMGCMAIADGDITSDMTEAERNQGVMKWGTRWSKAAAQGADLETQLRDAKPEGSEVTSVNTDEEIAAMAKSLVDEANSDRAEGPIPTDGQLAELESSVAAVIKERRDSSGTTTTVDADADADADADVDDDGEIRNPGQASPPNG